MEKKLTEYTNEQLFKLFPIKLRAYDANWPADYQKESGRLSLLLEKDLKRIFHVGSTSVPGMLAKPTVDILAEIDTKANLQSLISKLEGAGYIHLAQKEKPPPHMMFVFGYTTTGFAKKVFHVHIRYPAAHDELYFKEYLIENKQAAAQYAILKKELLQKYEYDRDAYTSGKTEFVKQITRIAKQKYTAIYE